MSNTTEVQQNWDWLTIIQSYIISFIGAYSGKCMNRMFEVNRIVFSNFVNETMASGVVIL